MVYGAFYRSENMAPEFLYFYMALCGIVGDCLGNGFEVQSFGKYVYLF